MQAPDKGERERIQRGGNRGDWGWRCPKHRLLGGCGEEEWATLVKESPGWISRGLDAEGWLSSDASIMRKAEGESWNASAERKRPGIGARKEEERINAIKPSDGKKKNPPPPPQQQQQKKPTPNLPTLNRKQINSELFVAMTSILCSWNSNGNRGRKWEEKEEMKEINFWQ